MSSSDPLYTYLLILMWIIPSAVILSVAISIIKNAFSREEDE